MPFDKQQIDDICQDESFSEILELLGEDSFKKLLSVTHLNNITDLSYLYGKWGIILGHFMTLKESLTNKQFIDILKSMLAVDMNERKSIKNKSWHEQPQLNNEIIKSSTSLMSFIDDTPTTTAVYDSLWVYQQMEKVAFIINLILPQENDPFGHFDPQGPFVDTMLDTLDNNTLLAEYLKKNILYRYQRISSLIQEKITSGQMSETDGEAVIKEDFEKTISYLMLRDVPMSHEESDHIHEMYWRYVGTTQLLLEGLPSGIYGRLMKNWKLPILESGEKVSFVPLPEVTRDTKLTLGQITAIALQRATLQEALIHNQPIDITIYNPNSKQDAIQQIEVFNDNQATSLNLKNFLGVVTLNEFSVLFTHALTKQPAVKSITLNNLLFTPPFESQHLEPLLNASHLTHLSISHCPMEISSLNTIETLLDEARLYSLTLINVLPLIDELEPNISVTDDKLLIDTKTQLWKTIAKCQSLKSLHIGIDLLHHPHTIEALEKNRFLENITIAGVLENSPWSAYIKALTLRNKAYLSLTRLEEEPNIVLLDTTVIKNVLGTVKELMHLRKDARGKEQAVLAMADDIKGRAILLLCHQADTLAAKIMYLEKIPLNQPSLQSKGEEHIVNDLLNKRVKEREKEHAQRMAQAIQSSFNLNKKLNTKIIHQLRTKLKEYIKNKPLTRGLLNDLAEGKKLPAGGKRSRGKNEDKKKEMGNMPLRAEDTPSRPKQVKGASLFYSNKDTEMKHTDMNKKNEKDVEAKKSLSKTKTPSHKK